MIRLADLCSAILNSEALRSVNRNLEDLRLEARQSLACLQT